MKRVAIGVGCRKDVSSEAVAALIREALSRLPRQPESARLFSIDRKRDEAGLASAAAKLGLPLLFLSKAELAAALDRVTVKSARVRSIMGVESIAEAAALAGAGASSRLLVSRLAANGATCAIAVAPSCAEDI